MEIAADLRSGFRQFRRAPGVAIAAVLSMALGIGAATAIFSVIHGVVLDPFPYKDVGSLMSIKLTEPGRGGWRTGYNVDQFLEFRERSTIFSGVTASTISDVFWTGRETPERLRGNHTTYDGLEIMGVPALAGRIFTNSDSGANVCVLGFRFWQRQFGGDLGAVGQKMLLNGKVRTVIGVMPPRFMWRGADVYIPLDFQRGTRDEGVQFVHVLGRLKPGVTEAQAEADLKPIVEELRRQNPAGLPEQFRVGLLSFAETFPSGITDVLWTLFGAVGLLLLIACLNVSSLLLTQGLRREKEMAIRTSLGADRRRIGRQLLTETFALALLGGALGIALAWLGVKGVLAMVPPFTIPDEADVRLNLPVLGFALALTVVTALLAGLIPALRAGRRDVVEPLKETARSSGSRRQSWFTGALVVAEVALSLILLVGASLMLRSMFAVLGTGYGVDTANVLTIRTPLDPSRYTTPERRALVAAQMMERLGEIPAIASVGINSNPHPFGNYSQPVSVPGVRDDRPVRTHHVSAGYLDVYKIPLRHGRMLDQTDIRAKRQYAVVSEGFVKRYLSGREPLGASFRVPGFRQPPFEMTDDAFEIVGVVGDTATAFNRELAPEIYLPHTLSGLPNFGVVLRPKTGDAMTLLPSVREAISSIDRDQALNEPQLIETMMTRFVTAGPKFAVVLFGAFAAIGMALVVVGVSGIVSNSVERRTREIGVRMALGARRSNVVALIVRQGIWLVGIGLVLGIAGAVAVTGVLRAFLRDISPYDPLSLAGAVLLLATIGFLASWLPARRAASIDPLTTLRAE